MKRMLFIAGVLALIFLVIFGLISLRQRGADNSAKINIVVSILPQKAFVRAVGGEHVTVEVLIPPGGSPATYEPKPSDLANVEKADIYFRIGYIPFEKSHADKLGGLNPNMKMVDTSVNVDLRYSGEDEQRTHDDAEEHHQEGIDPHIWLSPREVKKQVDVILAALSETDPNNSAEYLKNAENFKKELDNLHNEIERRFEGLKTNKFMMFHPAWGYFADEFGLEQIAIEQEGKEPTARQLQYLINKARQENIKVIFVQSQFTEEIAKSIAEEIDAVVVPIDPLSDDYINNLSNVATTIVEYLNR
jgi:zinc transport system substrate-binding protein